jgi:hypothetical protein
VHARASAEAPAKGGIAMQVVQRLTQCRLQRRDRDDHARFSDDRSVLSGVSGDDRAANAHRFQERQRKTFGSRREDENVCGAQKIHAPFLVRDDAEEPHLSMLSCQVLQLAPLGAGARDQEEMIIAPSATQE